MCTDASFGHEQLLCGQGIFVWMWAEFRLLTYNDSYTYPWWAQVFGLSLAFSSMVCIPGYFFFRLLSSPGSSFKQVSAHTLAAMIVCCDKLHVHG